MQKLTPLLKQYLKVKAEHEESILLFRMGDFYETFYKDAEIASKVLNIALTSRSHGKGNRVPLAGIPVKAADRYITALIKAGLKVAICEQLEDPALAKGIVKRGVTEVITPGTVTDPALIDAGKNIFLAAITTDGKDIFGISYCDLSTGDFFLTELPEHELIDELKRIDPGEILVQEDMDLEFLEGFVTTTVSGMEFQLAFASEKIKKHFGVETLAGFGIEDMSLGISAAGAVLSYLDSTQKRKLQHIKKLERAHLSDKLILDDATVRNLELIRRFDGSTSGTLLSHLNETKTPMGARFLRMNMLKPSYDIDLIEKRLDGVSELYDSSPLVRTLRKTIASISDLERIMGRIATERANARDLIQLLNSLSVLPDLKHNLSQCTSAIMKQIHHDISEFSELRELISSSIVSNPPITIKEGGIIKGGYHEQLDTLRSTASKGKDWIVNLEKQERQNTGIKSLKVKYNSVFGYYIEVTKANLEHVPPHYVRKQTLTNSERFITPELKEYEQKVLGSEEKMRALEYELFLEIRSTVSEYTAAMQTTAKAIGYLDMLLCFAHLSAKHHYSRPLIDNSDTLTISEGRHPVVEHVVEKGAFIPNDTGMNISDSQIIILTGPNMSGKSTYLRQVALITIMAQMGSFVPCTQAKIGIVDRVFTRIGASDDLTRGVSTFLAEMIETANILNNATKRSLVILDEVGRGTSTFDGLAIAWSVCEFLHNNPHVHPKTLFATHYHELTELQEMLTGIKNYNVSVKRWKDRIIFLRKVVPGGADESYGVDVANLAGLPEEVILRAREILLELEEKEMKDLKRKKRRISLKSRKTKQLPLFTPAEQTFLDELRNLDITRMTPLDALNTLSQWKKKLS
jgi:DNA mismatch repair protein MutS